MMPATLRDDPAALAEERHRAFNQGCDARLAGIPPAECPYRVGQESLANAWRQGWQDVDQHWSQDAFWPHKDLPPVTEARR
jgi:ribosome modulation factor